MLAARRDAGAGVIAARDVVSLRPFGLRSAVGLVVRLDAPVLAAWCIGAVAAGLAFGTIAKVASGAVSSSVSDTLEKFGVRGDFVLQYLGVAFLFFATIVALLPVSEIGAAAEDETAGRAAFLLDAAGIPARVARRAPRARRRDGRRHRVPHRRRGMARGEAAGRRSRPGPDGGRRPERRADRAARARVRRARVLRRAAAAVRAVYTIVIASLLFDVLTALSSSISWLAHLSLFHYMALAPAEHTDPTTVVVTLAVAAALCGAALVTFSRRDLAPCD